MVVCATVAKLWAELEILRIQLAVLVPGRGARRIVWRLQKRWLSVKLVCQLQRRRPRLIFQVAAPHAVGVAAIKDPRRIECVPASGNILEAQQMSWQRVQLIDKLLFSIAPAHSIGAKKKSRAARCSTLAISSHEVMSHINYSKAECCEFLIGFQPLLLFAHNVHTTAHIASRERVQKHKPHSVGAGIIVFVCKQICMEMDAAPHTRDMSK